MLLFLFRDKSGNSGGGYFHLFRGGNIRGSVAGLNSIAAEAGVISAVYDDLIGVRRKIRTVLLIAVHVEYSVPGTVHRQHIQSAAGDIRRRVGRQKYHPGKLPGMPGGAACRHGPSEGVPADIPAADLRELRRDSVGGADVKHCKVEGHFHQHALYSLLGNTVHKRRIGGVFHLAAGIEDKSGGSAPGRRENQIVAQLAHCDGGAGYQRGVRYRVRMVVVPSVNKECCCNSKNNRQHNDDYSP